MEPLYYWLYFPELGEVAISKATAESGLTIYSPELQGYTDKALRDFANNAGDGYFTENPYTRESGLEFAAWYLQNEIADGCAELAPMIY